VEKCVNCQYYDRRNAKPNEGRTPVMWGQCRRHSPHLSPAVAQKAYLVEGVWPLIRDDDWCGEWCAPARSAVARVRFTPRTVEAPGASPVASTAAAAEAATMAVAGD
jgi:hypothetical protein